MAPAVPAVSEITELCRVTPGTLVQRQSDFAFAVMMKQDCAGHLKMLSLKDGSIVRWGMTDAVRTVSPALLASEAVAASRAAETARVYLAAALETRGEQGQDSQGRRRWLLRFWEQTLKRVRERHTLSDIAAGEDARIVYLTEDSE